MGVIMKILVLISTALVSVSAFAFDGVETLRCKGPNHSDVYEIKLFTETSNVRPVVKGEFAIVKLVAPQVPATHSSYVIPAGGVSLKETAGRDEVVYLITDKVNNLVYSNCRALDFEALIKSSP